MDKEFLEKAYAEVSDNIKFSEAKNAALITLNSALIATSVDKIFDSNVMFYWRALIAAGSILLLIPLFFSVLSFKATIGEKNSLIKKLYNYSHEKDKIEKDASKYMFYAYIAKYYTSVFPSKYLEDVGCEVGNTFCLQLASQIIDLAHVAYRKFILFNLSITIELSLFGIGGFAALAMIIYKTVIHLI